MCGIFAGKMAVPDNEVFHNAMRYLQYRGYDSWGFSYDGLNLKSIEKYKDEILEIAGRINLGILHTRWATTGEVSLENAHPIQVEGYSMVMNGIVTNHRELGLELKGLKTDTDTEVLLHTYISGNLKDAKGNFAFVVKHPGNRKIYAYRRGIPLYACWQQPGNVFITSDIGAIEGEFHYSLIDEDILLDIDFIHHPEMKFQHRNYRNAPVTAYMTESGSLTLDELRESRSIISKLGERKFHYTSSSVKSFIGSGSSYNAALFAQYLSGSKARAYIPYEYKDDMRDTAIFISQSGESFDILDVASKSKPIRHMCMTNNTNSSLAKITGKTIPLECGLEQAVGATKSFIAQCYLLSKMIGYDFKPEINVNEHELNTSLSLIMKSNTLFFLGNEQNYAIAREGALKFKELALVYAEAFPTTEFKHGPLALTDSNSLAIIVGHGHKESIVADQIVARGGAVLYIDAENPWNAIYSVQYLAIKTALAKGINPDFPRNLAKSITVE